MQCTATSIKTGQILKWSFVATALFVVIELIAGIRAGSLALHLRRRPQLHRRPVAGAGLHRPVSGIQPGRQCQDLRLSSRRSPHRVCQCLHAGRRSRCSSSTKPGSASCHPQPVEEWTMFWVAWPPWRSNGAIMWGLHRDKDHDLNIRAAFVHMLGDAVSSVAIIFGASRSTSPGWNSIDPMLSVLIGALIIWTAWDIIEESLNVLLEGLPRGIELEPGHGRHARGRGRDGRPRSAHLEPGIQRPRAELPRADRRHAAVGKQFHPAAHQRVALHVSRSTTPPSSSNTPSARSRMRLARSWSATHEHEHQS